MRPRLLWAANCLPIQTDKTPEARRRGGEGGGGGGRDRCKYHTTRFPSRTRVLVEGPLRLGTRLGIQSPFFALSFWSLLCPCGAYCPVCRARGRGPLVLVCALPSLHSFYAVVVLVERLSRTCLGLCSSWVGALSCLLNLTLGVLSLKYTVLSRVTVLNCVKATPPFSLALESGTWSCPVSCHWYMWCGCLAQAGELRLCVELRLGRGAPLRWLCGR
jgi:hypothetical protein